MSRPLKVMLVATEASADALGAGLARALKARLGDAVGFCGVGGAKMAAEGVASPIDIGGLSLVGLFEIASAVPRVLGDIETTVRLAEVEQPDVAVLIDSWGITWRVARRMRLRTPDVAIVKYVAPQVWATRPSRARALARSADLLLALFAFEAPYFECVGLPVTVVGSPIFGRDCSGVDPGRLRAEIGATPDDPILLVLPGSRSGEIRRIMPAFEDAALRLMDDRPSLRVVVAAADTVADVVKARVAGWRRPAHVVEGEAARREAMCAATVALTKSGTVTTELAVAGCPMVVGYRGHPLTAIAARLIAKVRYLTLINIAANAEVAPEYLQERCTGPELAMAVSALLDDPSKRAKQVEAQFGALERLGAGVTDADGRAADAVIDLMRRRGWSPD